MRRRFNRSATTPANGDTNNTGACDAKLTRPKKQRRIGEPVDQPRLRDRLHPEPDQRDRLTGEEQAVITMAKDAEESALLRNHRRRRFKRGDGVRIYVGYLGQREAEPKHRPA